MAIGILLGCVAGACADEAAELPTSESVAPPLDSAPQLVAPLPSVEQGRALVEKHECSRCHEGTNLAQPAQEKRCFGCHEDIVSGAHKAPAAQLRAWHAKVVTSRFAPSLSGVGSLLEPKWVSGYLLRPHRVRPALEATMPILGLSAVEADSIALYLASLNVPAKPSVPPQGDVERGRAAFMSKGCATCHEFTGARLAARTKTRSDANKEYVLAPDLAFARSRILLPQMVAYLQDPKAIKPDAAMPQQILKAEEAADLAAFILTTPLDTPQPAKALKRLPLLERQVGYDEVATRVFQRTCWHCHAQPDFARGDGGPGNSGGFGFAPRRLDLTSFEAILAGFVDKNGKRRSLFSPTPSGDSVLVDSLTARHAEEIGRQGPTRGMPLGLPPLSAEEIQLVETWVKQGHSP